MKPLVVGSFEAKNRLSELLDCVLKGQEVLILRRNQPAARLVPASSPGPSSAPSEKNWLKRARQIRQQAHPGKESIKSLIEEGRR